MLDLAVARDKELEVALTELERLQAERRGRLHRLFARTKRQIDHGFSKGVGDETRKRCTTVLAVCGNDEKLWQRVCHLRACCEKTRSTTP